MGQDLLGDRSSGVLLKLDDKSCLYVRFVYYHSREGEIDGAGESGENGMS